MFNNINYNLVIATLTQLGLDETFLMYTNTTDVHELIRERTAKWDVLHNMKYDPTNHDYSYTRQARFSLVHDIVDTQFRIACAKLLENKLEEAIKMDAERKAAEEARVKEKAENDAKWKEAWAKAGCASGEDVWGKYQQASEDFWGKRTTQTYTSNDNDPYIVLGVQRTASKDEIKVAYRKLSMQHHPDRGGDEEMMKKINVAYDKVK